ncbi:hypothetical protein GLOTRDRAFT_125112 [Gloeophyllum trabeum ATCC 11539]|uniref:F-box domain-containing protein n=1 Tax=Gloeophyllum trabeum (strain ATCC 11539 / FP-39264 / Madison 617) TaxID=670483 RepID=S7QHW2_GLOTA|nr:uncharacterized protein GLOTRDRAFT_125112 [Gloeophyllum trabeum ATCC 11539]EPQ58782.1 hypothetical protein GLOTRDRAFT_125112 [Gloeophyllum trabeum ATCC 11539]
MDALPAELVVQIVEFACTDGGHTACALRATSKYLCRASEPFRFYTVALRNPKQSPCFLEAFKDSSQLARASARHLFIAIYKENAQVGNLILQSISRTIETLTCVLREPDDKPLRRTTFPRLAALTLVYHEYTARLFSRLGPFPDTPTLPRLRDLHIAHRRPALVFRAHVSLDWFARRAGGALVRARVSGVELDDAWVLMLQDILARRPVRYLPPVPAGLARYVVELCHVPDAQMVEELRALQRWAKQEGVVEFLLSPWRSRAHMTPGDWEAEWLAVQRGAVRPRVERLDDDADEQA